MDSVHERLLRFGLEDLAETYRNITLAYRSITLAYSATGTARDLFEVLELFFSLDHALQQKSQSAKRIADIVRVSTEIGCKIALMYNGSSRTLEASDAKRSKSDLKKAAILSRLEALSASDPSFADLDKGAQNRRIANAEGVSERTVERAIRWAKANPDW